MLATEAVNLLDYGAVLDGASVCEARLKAADALAHIPLYTYERRKTASARRDAPGGGGSGKLLETQKQWSCKCFQKTGSITGSNDSDRDDVALMSSALDISSEHIDARLVVDGAAQPERSAPVHSEQRSSWWQSAATVLAEVMGTGVLSLPHACARLGWVLGLGSSVLFGLLAIYCGHLLSACKNELYPNAVSYADLATATGGRRFGVFTRGALLTGWASILPYYLVAAAAALGAALPAAGLCHWQWCLVLMLVMLPALQLRSLHALSYLSVFSTVAVILVLLLLVPGLVSNRPAAAASSVGLPAGQSFLNVYGAFGAFIFAYQGQSVFLEIMREMRTPTDFPKAVRLANGTMLLCYTAISAVGYGAHGDAVAPFLPDTLAAGAVRSLVGVLLAFHTLVSYLVTGQPLHRAVHLYLAPSTCDAPSMRGALHWLGVTSSFLLLAFVVANVIPFFADLYYARDLLGNLFGAATLFGWPAFFYARGMRLHGLRLSRFDAVMCATFLLVCLPLFTVLGTLNSILTIIDDWHLAGKRPFECMQR